MPGNTLPSVPLSVAVAVILAERCRRSSQMNWTIWTLAVGRDCVSLAIRGRAKPGLRPFVFGFLVCSFLCVCPGFYFRSPLFHRHAADRCDACGRALPEHRPDQ